MIYGSGLVASAMAPSFPSERIVVYAAGVSNSSCNDASEFLRERERLQRALDTQQHSERFLYFSTCSVEDPSASESMYVKHKLAMESLVREHPRHLNLRLPQVAGQTPNPHTLLNFLHARISRSEKFEIWERSTRNVLDIDDIAMLVSHLVLQEGAVNETINVANPASISVSKIVAEMAKVVGKPAVYETRVSGSSYSIDCARIEPAIRQSGVNLQGNYLERVLKKYYG
jgi:nucleoside-diphosphate-sugar epimerase